MRWFYYVISIRYVNYVIVIIMTIIIIKTTINKERRHVKLVQGNKPLPLSINQLTEIISCLNKPVSWAGCDVSNNVNVNQGIRQLTAPRTSYTCDDVRADRHAPCGQTKESCPRQEYQQSSPNWDLYLTTWRAVTNLFNYFIQTYPTKCPTILNKLCI